MKQKFSVTTIWDSRAINPKTKASRVMLCILLNNKRFMVTVPIRCTKADYERSFGQRSLSDVQRQIKDEINALILKAEGIIERLGKDTTKDLFLRFFKSNVTLSASEKTDVFEIMQQHIDQCNAENRFGSAMNIYNARNSFKLYKDKIYFEDIDEKFLKAYKRHMTDTGRSSSTAGIYIRALRSIYQQCVKDKIIVSKENPFENVSVGYTIKSKSVLYPEQVKALWFYQPDGVREIRAKDFFFFCYLCNGMNFKDVSLLKKKDIKNDMIVFVRQKTKETTDNPREIMVYLHDEVKRILSVHGTTSTDDNAYLFDIFNGCSDLAHHNATFTRYKRQTNKSLNAIAKKLNIDSRIYLGIARHSFATRLKLDGTPTSFISEFMGHSNEKSTSNYLKSLPSDIHRQMNSKLLSF